jgi:uncharacterized Rossmann fold enzyme
MNIQPAWNVATNSWTVPPSWRPGDLVKLTVKGRCILPDETLYEHMRVARGRFPELVKAQVPPFAERLLIVGAGLSLLEYRDTIIERAKSEPVMALKGTHDWLIEQGVTPTYAVASDPQQSRYNVFKRLNDDTIYLLASQMHPDTWDYMQGRKVIVWHSEQRSDHRTREDWKDIPLVFGGSTTGSRALTLAYLLGFRNVDLYGMDSSVAYDGTYKIDGTKLREGDKALPVWVGDRMFNSALSLVPQVAQIRDVLMMLPGIKVEPHGDGYLQEVIRQGKAAGWPV